MNITTSILVGYNHSTDSDNAVLVVGQKGPNDSVNIINAFSGDEATELWNKLTIKETNNA